MWSVSTLAEQSALIQVSGTGATATAEFKLFNQCNNPKVEGNFGCLKINKGTKQMLVFALIGSPGWEMVEIQIRKVFEDWNDVSSIDATIRSSYLEPPPPGPPSVEFFTTDNGVHTFSPGVTQFRIWGANTSAHTVQYRIRVSDGTNSIWVHPIIENEG
jgi:hypothetical protein